MKITEKMLLDGLSGITQGGDYISTISDKKIFWAYRYEHEEGWAVCERERADFVTLEYDRVGEIDLDSDNDNHPAIAVIARMENELWGNEIAL